MSCRTVAADLRGRVARRPQFVPGGSLRRSSSKKLKMKLTLFTAAVSSAPGAFNTAKRLPSGCKSKLEMPPPRVAEDGSVNWPGDQSCGLSARKETPEAV